MNYYFVFILKMTFILKFSDDPDSAVEFLATHFFLSFEPQVAHDEQPQQDSRVSEEGDVTGGVASRLRHLLNFGGLL